MRNTDFERTYVMINLARSALLFKKMLFIHFVTFPKTVSLLIQMKQEQSK